MTEMRAEKIFRGGTILTMDDSQRQVAAVAVAGGRNIAAGDEATTSPTAVLQQSS